MSPESGHCIPGGDAASASHALPAGAGAPGPTCIYFGGEQAVVIRREGRFVLAAFHCDAPVLIPVEDVVWA